MRCNLSLLHHFLMLFSFYCFIFENVVSLHRILVFRFVCLSILHFWSVYTFVRLLIFFLIHAQVLPRYQWVIQSSPCCVYLCLWMWKIRSYIHMNERTSERTKERKCNWGQEKLLPYYCCRCCSYFLVARETFSANF